MKGEKRQENGRTLRYGSQVVQLDTHANGNYVFVKEHLQENCHKRCKVTVYKGQSQEKPLCCVLCAVVLCCVVSCVLLCCVLCAVLVCCCAAVPL